MAKKFQIALAMLLGIFVFQLGLSHFGRKAGPRSAWTDLSAFRAYSRQFVEQATTTQDQDVGELKDSSTRQDEPKTPVLEEANNDNKPRPKIAKITMLYGDTYSEAYERALESHSRHADMHGYPMYVLRQKILGRLWTKPAWILGVVLEELAKPPKERLEWLFWFDADTFLLNPKIPLEIYLPPPDVSGVNFLCGNDHNGLNDGAFLLRINDYSVHLLASSLSVETFRPTVDLRYSEQSAIEHVVHEGGVYRPWDGTTYLDGYAEIPQRWLNAYMGARDDHGVPIPAKKEHPNGVRPGDLLLHFAGSGATKVQRIKSFVQAYEKDESEWVKEVDQMPELVSEISQFWESYSQQQKSQEQKSQEQKSQEQKSQEQKSQEQKSQPKEKNVEAENHP
ncbi:uncharacterized protein Z520_06542 [Fonsecaea multimorphosa CBS 102226]|uniref:Galactosyl transferase GMA12/MNN10 family protein n=1 Tax=Fonsecaea multimorphosa CBS 102226 TaxID=1442371 RepID=A0A0D2K3K9_9EURO|nr:uncharacterized protein Z520_06542 [Fonsecaea multimorphosa CBS 102226]KIX97764.1 hypothetical protein Z520_06542 [Fonsecaea multimorphosa CBS 102226]OAL23784.1 hypothetical protein AYO22_06103 [Fonsecaea multimorphosa]